MATSGQFQKQYASPPARTYLTTNLAQRRPVPRPKPIPQPVPQPDVQAKDDRDSSTSQPRYPNLIWNPTRYGVQPKLTVGAPNDQYEQEADRVADQVMSMPDSNLQQPVQREATLPEDEELQTKPIAASITPLVQREDMPEDEELQTKTSGNLDIQREDNLEEEEIQMKSLEHSSIQREDNLEEEEIQTKSSLQRSPDGSLQAGSSIENRLNSSKGGGSPLPDDVRSFMEPRFGADFSQVRVHTGSEAVQMNRDLNAQAFTHKQDVYFGGGKAPGKDALTAHELTHVVQQTGAVQTHLNSRQAIIQSKCSVCTHEEALLQRQEASPPVPNNQEFSYEPGEVDASLSSPGGVDIANPSTLFNFGVNRADPKPEHQTFLKNLVNESKLNQPNSPFSINLIEGFSDVVDKKKGNKGLRQARAETVNLSLIRLGVPVSRIQIVRGAPKTNFISDNNTQEGRARNRAVTLRLEQLSQPPTTTDHQPPTTTDHQPPTTTDHQPPTTTDHQPPTTTDHQPPTTTEPPNQVCPKSYHWQARITSSLTFGVFPVGGGMLGLEVHNVDCKRGQRFKYSGGGHAGKIGTPIGIGGTSEFKKFSTERPLHFEDFVGLGRWTSAQAQIGIGPSIDFVILRLLSDPTITLEYDGLLNFPDQDTEETGKGVGYIITVGSWKKDGSEFSTGE